MLQTLAGQENDPIPNANDVFSDSDGNQAFTNIK